MFVYDNFSVSNISSDIKWSPMRGPPDTSTWPPRGLHLKVHFKFFRDIVTAPSVTGQLCDRIQ